MQKNRTHILFHTIFINESYAFTCICTQKRHFGNSKMVNWVNIDQKLTKLQVNIPILKNINFCFIKHVFFNKKVIFQNLNVHIIPRILVNFWTIFTQFTILEFSKCLLWVHRKVKSIIFSSIWNMLWNKMWV